MEIQKRLYFFLNDFLVLLDFSLTSFEFSVFNADLKDVVWVVKIYIAYKHKETLTYALVFLVDKIGLLMASAHLFRKYSNNMIMACRK